jgi:putative ABC transport system permease protein
MTMSLLRWFRDVRDARRLDLESREELAHHVELAVAEKMRGGLGEVEARRVVRLELGNPEAAHETLHEARGGSWLESLLRDVTYSWRTLRQRPAFVSACVLTIALGVGASTALFAVVDAVVLRPLPLPEPERLVRIYDTHLSTGVARTGVTTGNLTDWRRRARAVRGLAGHFTMGRTLTLGADSEVVRAAQVTEDFFPVVGVPAAVGRAFTAEETAASLFNRAAAPVGADPVMVISHALWRRRFGGDPGVVGRTVTLERRPFRVVGVMPPGFAVPDADVQVYLPWGLSGKDPRDQHYVQAVARLAPGVSLEQAQDELRGIAGALAAEHPTTNAGWSVALVPLRDDVVGDAGPTLMVLLGAVGLVLLVACANVALLFLARGLERSHDAMVRLALGATRRRLVRQSLVESGLLCAVGGGLGVLLAAAGLSLLARADAGLPRVHEVAFDRRALAFALVATAAATLLAGLPAALRRVRGEPAADLTGTPARVAAGGNRLSLRDGLVVAEVAMAVVLVAGASLLLRSYQRLQAVDPGYDPRGVLVAPIFLDMEGYGRGFKSRTYYEQLVERLEALPGVVSAGGATALPASPLGPNFDRPVWPEGAPETDHARWRGWVRVITPRYFETLGMRLVEGRAFDGRDRPDGALAVILSRNLARTLWPDGSAVGRRLTVDYSTSGTYPYDVVGVVEAVRFAGPRQQPPLELYLAHAQRPYLVMNMAVRTSGDPRHLAPAVRAVLRDLDPTMPPHGLNPLTDLLGATYARDRHALRVLAAFAAAAALLSLLGIHGILIHRVRERTREIGIRVAVGADRSRVLRWMGAYALRLVLAGIALGSLLAVASARLVSGLLFDMGVLDPAPLLGVVGLAAVALLVSLHPAWRATRVDAAEVLRAG